jgi:replicative DNA helicase
MKNAIAFSDYFIEHAKATFGCIKSDGKIEDARYLLDVLKRKRVLLYKRQQLWSAIKHKFHSAEPFNNALEILEDRGYIRIKTIKAQRGRNGEVIECNPMVIEGNAS